MIDTIVATAGRDEAPAAAVEVRHWGGAIVRPTADAGPVGHRDVPFSVTVDGSPRPRHRSRATRRAARS